MSEIRSQATPARDELAEKQDALGKIALDILRTSPWAEGLSIRNCILLSQAIGGTAARDGWSKPRTVNSATELKALPKCSLIRGLEREGQRSGDVFEKVGPDHWLCLDPGDRFDGEETTPSHAIVLIYKAGIRVLFTPGEAG